MNSASFFDELQASCSQMLGMLQPPRPMRARSMRSPASFDDELPDDESAAVREEVQLLAQRVDADLEVLDDRVALALVLERVLARAVERVLRHVEHLTDADGLALVDERLAAARDEERLHELARHRRVEELARLRPVARAR